MDRQHLIKEFPQIQNLIDLKEFLWINPEKKSFDEAAEAMSLGMKDIIEASERLERFAPFIRSAFPETEDSRGIIESELLELTKMKSAVEKFYGTEVAGRMFLKCDHALPISGSIKARGGIYEVLKHAEELAIGAGKLASTDCYSKLDSDELREFFAQYHVAVGSTGNLGLSIGIMSAKIGFKVSVHMSADAKQWKKDLLRAKGVEVIEYQEDYSKAVEEGRKLSEADPKSYFVDDENSVNLFLGYSVAALRLQKQLEHQNIRVDREHPLFVYLPCGVGGGPGGVAFGLKQIFGDAVHFFFAEPTHSPCMLLGCMTKTHDRYAVQDFGIDNKTIADGLAVGRASGFVGKTLEHSVSGCYTIEDEKMLALLALMTDHEAISLEPSALAGFGILNFFGSEEFEAYLAQNKIEAQNISHLMWATGGSMVPNEVQAADYRKGKALLSE